MEAVAIVLLIVVVWALLSGARRERSDSASGVPDANVSGRVRGFLSQPQRTRLYEFRNIIVEDERGTTEIDAVVVGNSGVFVIEIKDFNAWIFGEEHDERWTACYFDSSKHTFQNPLRQNFRHLKALEAKLALSPDVFRSIVAFTGNCEFKTPIPSNVIRGDFRVPVSYSNGVVLRDEDVMRVCSALQAAEAASDGNAMAAHVASLRERFDSVTHCPKCGGALVERVARNGSRAGGKFLGCASYPRCRYTRDVERMARDA